MKSNVLSVLFIAAALCLGLRADLRRRRLSFRRRAGWRLLTVLDLCSVILTLAIAATLLAQSQVFWGVGISMMVLFFLWREGKRQVQLQRPAGIVFGEWCVLLGVYLMFFPGVTGTSLKYTPVVAGVVLLGFLVPSFLKGREEHRILAQVSTQDEFIQQEWAAPTPECPFPERWKMFDAQSAELEVLEFLKSLVITVKPDLIVETGTFVGHSAISMAAGLKANGFGKLVTVEYDPAVFEKADENIRSSGLGEWIDARCMSSLAVQIEGTIDILYSDSDITIREYEVRRFLPQIKPGGLVLIHDASSSFHVVREAAQRLEEEGLLSMLLLSTPRGLVIAQKRSGRR